MRNSILYLLSSVLLLPLVSSCSTANEDDGCLPGGHFNKIHTEKFATIDASYTAGPTAYGENLYAEFKAQDGYVPFTNWESKHLKLGVNTDKEGNSNFYNGGVCFSNWNTYQSQEGSEDQNWYTHKNQCSVYNTQAVSGSRKGGGYDDDSFIVVTGLKNEFGGDYARISFKHEQAGMHFLSLKVCNTAYVAGVAQYGNDLASSLKEKKGYLRLIVQGGKSGKTLMDANKRPIQDSFMLVDYRNDKSLLVDQWTDFVLTNLAQHEVDYIEFLFDGSDQSEYGLNTPAYACIDDLRYGVTR